VLQLPIPDRVTYPPGRTPPRRPTTRGFYLLTMIQLYHTSPLLQGHSVLSQGFIIFGIYGARHFLSDCKNLDESFPILILVPKLLCKCLAPDFEKALAFSLAPVEGLASRQSLLGVYKSWGSERRLSSVTYRNQASGSPGNPLGLDTSLRSYPLIRSATQGDARPALDSLFSQCSPNFYMRPSLIASSPRLQKRA
jgi:hypothetical protein